MGGIPQRGRKASRTFLLFSLLFTGTALADPARTDLACPNLPFDDRATIRYIYDGDTLHLKDGRKVRLIGINTPELAREHKPAEPFAVAAKEALEALFQKDSAIALIYGKNKKDRYGRILAHAYSADEKNVQLALLRSGFASAITYPPNTRYSACYRAAEHEARCNHRGLWENTAILNATELSKHDTGFHLVSGRVKNIDINSNGIWLNLDDRLTVGIRPGNRQLFDIDAIINLLNQSITVRGWLNKSHNRKSESNPFYLRVRHPASIQLSSTLTCE